MKKIIKHKVNAVAPRLSDEDPDPIEQDEVDMPATLSTEGWLPWDPEDIIDIKRLVENHMEPKQKEIIDAFLNGLNYNDIEVTEKYWRWHFTKAIEFIRKELKL